jgi:hypothetical protein
MSTFELSNSVSNKESFIEFLELLAKHCKINSNEISNINTIDFIEAAAAWLEDSDGFYQNTGQKQPKIDDWKAIAHLFSAALIYE